MSTRSPVLYSFFSSCALYFVRLVMYLPYLACERRRSTSTTRVFCILSLVTMPMSSRRLILPRSPLASGGVEWPAELFAGGLGPFDGPVSMSATVYFSFAA